MKKVKRVVFRKLTGADWFNINKPPGTEVEGGGQSYIDFPTSEVNLKQWKDFFEKIPAGQTYSGPSWSFQVHSLGVNTTQVLTIGQRRKASFSIRSQKISSRSSNRVYAWHPDYTNFPFPKAPSKREHIENLVIYIAYLEDESYWAGWFQRKEPDQDWSINNQLYRMFVDGAGIIENTKGILFDATDSVWPFKLEVESKFGPKTTRKPLRYSSTTRSEDEIIKDLFDEDETILSGKTPKEKREIRKIKARNQKLARLLKELYKGKCQISDEEFTFKKRDGSLYSEIHHLIPLGENGSDSLYNIIVVSPLIHKMLHYADVSEIDLNEIKDNQLRIIINNKEYTIKWHPKHLEKIEEPSNQ